MSESHEHNFTSFYVFGLDGNIFLVGWCGDCEQYLISEGTDAEIE